jgi:hypothetical protein
MNVRGFAAARAALIFLYALSPAPARADEMETQRRELERLQERVEEAERQRREDQQQIELLKKKLERMESERAAETAPSPEVVAVQPERLNVFNPSITIFGNALWRLDDRKVVIEEDGDEERIDDTFNLRETEADFRASIDPYADGVFIATLESEVPGEFEVGVEEGYAVIKHLPFLEAPPLGLQLKPGRFRAEFGRINRLHTHDLPQSTRPLAVESFLGSEGYIANGISARLFLPSLLDEDSAWVLTTQVFQGGDIAVAEDGTRDPAFLGNLQWSRVFAAEHFADASAIFHYGNSDENGKRDVYTYSIDALYKWQPLRQGQWRSFLLGGQLFFSDREFDVVPEEEDEEEISLSAVRRTNTPLGGFLFSQYQFNRRLFAGIRGDWAQDIEDDSHDRWAVHPYVSYYLSEFLRLRLGYEHRWSDLQDEDNRDSVFTEINFVFGSHPPEPFWVNR